MSLAPWRSPLARALHRNRSLVYARYLQLATVRSGGYPANRTVVFRGFLDPTNQLKFITDIRSSKIEQILLQPWGEACWYFPKTREQFRLLGKLTIVSAVSTDAELLKVRRNLWSDLSDAARVQFAWPESGSLRSDAAAFKALPPDTVNPLPNFCLLLFDLEQVDHLELRGDPPNRCLYLKNTKENRKVEDAEWFIQAVNP